MVSLTAGAICMTYILCFGGPLMLILVYCGGDDLARAHVCAHVIRFLSTPARKNPFCNASVSWGAVRMRYIHTHAGAQLLPSLSILDRLRRSSSVLARAEFGRF